MEWDEYICQSLILILIEYGNGLGHSPPLQDLVFDICKLLVAKCILLAGWIKTFMFFVRSNYLLRVFLVFLTVLLFRSGGRTIGDLGSHNSNLEKESTKKVKAINKLNLLLASEKPQGAEIAGSRSLANQYVTIQWRLISEVYIDINNGTNPFHTGYTKHHD